MLGSMETVRAPQRRRRADKYQPQRTEMDEKTRKQIISIIDAVDDMTVATVRADAYPQATTVSYVNDGLTLYFGTFVDSQKARNIAANNRVSLTINRDYDSWDEIEGLSLAGRATPVSEPDEQDKVTRLISAKFPQGDDYMPEGASQDDMIIFRIDPEVISLLDYKRQFGHTELIEVP